jgi:lipoprotein-anchoring transpeptidase ErfK/SrfK
VRSGTFIAVAALVVLFLAGGAGVYAYDEGTENQVAQGVHVGGIHLGGLSQAQARQKLRDELLEPLSSPVVVRSRGERFRLTAKEARVAANIDAMVAEAIARGRDGNVVTRAFRNLTGGEVQADIDPEVTYSSEAVGRLVSRVKRGVERAPRDAKVDFSATGLKKVDGRDGLQIDRRALREKVESAILSAGEGERTVTAKAKRIKPKVTTAELADKYGTVVTVDRSNFTLRLFKNLKLRKSYRIAVGKVGLDTPAGLYNIQNKAVNPAWNVPNSDWAGDLAGQVIPGGTPQNPLKARWLGIYNGVGIHGTAERGSIGSNASHGCIRMLVEDVTDLYDDVPVGAPVYIA